MSKLCAVLVAILVTDIVLVAGKIGNMGRGNGIGNKSVGRGRGQGQVKTVTESGGGGTSTGGGGPRGESTTESNAVTGTEISNGGTKKILKCAVCEGKTFEECSEDEKIQPCPPGHDRSCIVSIKATSMKKTKIKIKKQCTKKKICENITPKRSKECLKGNVTKGSTCNFCCDTDECNKGWPRPQLDKICTSWSNWTECSATCGPGKQSRQQTCAFEIVGYNFWQTNSLGHTLEGSKRDKRSAKPKPTEVSFLPKVPSKVTKKKVNVDERSCHSRPCETGEKPVTKPVPTEGSISPGSAGSSSASVMFTIVMTLIVVLF